MTSRAVTAIDVSHMLREKRMNSVKTHKILTYTVGALITVALFFVLANNFSDEPWAQHSNEARNVLYIGTALSIALGYTKPGRKLG